MYPSQFVPIVIAAVILIGGLALFWIAEKKRQETLALLAKELGWRFQPGLDRSHDEEYSQFEIFRRGHSRAARNTMTGHITLFDQQCALVAGDFRYKVTSHNHAGFARGFGHSARSHNRKKTTTYRFSYMIVHPPWDTPPLLIRPEGIFDKIKGAIGFDDIDFESAEFSRKFYVKSTDKRFAYDVLHPRMMEFLLATSPPLIDIEDGALCLSDGKRRWDPERFRKEMAFIEEFCGQWPRHLLKELNK